MRHLRARCAVAKAAALGTGSAAARPLLDGAEHDARLLERERIAWAAALAQLIHAAVAAGRGETAAAIARLSAAVAGLEAADMRQMAAVARRRLGELKGGAEGSALVAQMNAWLTAQKVRNPDRYAAMSVPGFRGAPAEPGACGTDRSSLDGNPGRSRQ
jgi:hypothetical protein